MLVTARLLRRFCALPSASLIPITTSWILIYTPRSEGISELLRSAKTPDLLFFFFLLLLSRLPKLHLMLISFLYMFSTDTPCCIFVLPFLGLYLCYLSSHLEFTRSLWMACFPVLFAYVWLVMFFFYGFRRGLLNYLGQERRMGWLLCLLHLLCFP